MGVSIKSIGIYVPSHVVTNEDLEKNIDTSDEWITTRTGIKRRHIAKDESIYDMAVKAGKMALEKAGLEEVDLIIVATLSPEMLFPAVACVVQQHIKSRFAFDISAACSGFLYGLDIAKSYIESSNVNSILLIGAEKLSSIVDWTDRSTCVLFGDGAGAAVITKGEGDILSSVMFSDGKYKDLLYAEKCGFLKMNGKEVFKYAVRNMEAACRMAIEKAGVSIDEISLVIPHQANIRIINSLAQKLGVPSSKVYVNIQEYANTSAASIPIAMYEAFEKGLLKRKDKILLTAMGGGLTWGASVLEF
ncbi:MULTISPECIES: beta-ketoacyl-ACP synthase III [unclassified Hydrogenobaculum]|uniref:beta-ketoacyl-ACP synthase III n=1 Tax=unclassified Hydrogenobaculum TaxID=2622382 RepID=UPI0001C5070E|nr:MULTISPECIES: beta-ketoacyl-ACP synthase III [unclassified Hydrogenobaculum]AEF18640.1 3-oxoacyl-(acyl-carrier-protein) synthase III [Hydrogenobaculum sp. 3684]AEG45928.1 3-oxoacyl-(acyl-carrier-protein) synthase 3 [Hydrogenobaculum sp. SHO]AGG14571.1 3-oxoacyl-(acyl-carrier-protein) synthase III [Hydrogenobaculum sp. HO]AGH92871.1 3-oxoacyl-(acyl-carrier-protein) synthase III [Hydrogenobaculum sp. SN]